MSRSGSWGGSRAGDPGRGVFVLGFVALVLHAWGPSERLSAREVGVPLELRLEELQGPGFRLLPGVGPVLAVRLEAARVAAGGVLDREAAAAVRGVGPSLLSRWEQMRSR